MSLLFGRIARMATVSMCCTVEDGPYRRPRKLSSPMSLCRAVRWRKDSLYALELLASPKADGFVIQPP